MEEILKQILSQVQSMQNEMIDVKKNMVTKQDVADLKKSVTQEIKDVSDKIDQLALEGQKDVIAMIGLVDKKLIKSTLNSKF